MDFWVEIVSLLVPGFNDSDDEMKQMAERAFFCAVLNGKGERDSVDRTPASVHELRKGIQWRARRGRFMAFVIAEPCIGTKDTACVDACPVDCIHPKKNTTYDDGRPVFDDVEKLYIDPVECIDCGACVPVCPVSAIFAMDDLPAKWSHYAEIDASYVVGGKFQPDKFKK
jgi:NAD-dependent dihydropyrimidine dehydrogenase PreA subunit